MLPLSFFMFWFFYKSGMFYRKKPNIEIVVTGAKKLLHPYVIFSVIGHLIKCVQLMILGDFNIGSSLYYPIKQLFLAGAVSGNMALWFLPTLFVVQVLYAKLSRNITDGCIIVISLVIAYSLFKMNIVEPVYLGNMSLGLAVYAFGHMMKDYQYKCPVFTFAVFIYFAVLLFEPSRIDFRVNDCCIGYYFLAFAFSLSACIAINNLFRRLNFRIGFLEWIGKRSMNFYVMHWIVLLSISIVFSASGWTKFFALMIGCIVILPILDKLYCNLVKCRL